ncbi:uncharacterized protein V1518DRAFT_415057 [Limtongia smithiae]|uniref:uncharacterized protein n=1 Tax=Limtongia smithiae TaxID=1125753 RepID=UPI0034CD2DDD
MQRYNSSSASSPYSTPPISQQIPLGAGYYQPLSNQYPPYSNMPTNSNYSRAGSTSHHHPPQPQLSLPPPPSQTAATYTAPPPSTFTLPDYITEKIPPETADLFQRDEHGKLLWFSVPPVDAMHVVSQQNMPARGQMLGHSLEFLAKRAEIIEKRKRRAAERDMIFGKKASFSPS